MKTTTILIVVVCFIFFSNCNEVKQETQFTQTDEEVAKDISMVWKDFLEAWQNAEVDICISMLTTDYVNYLDYSTTQNLQEVKDMFNSMQEYNMIQDAKYERIELFVHDNMAYEFCWFEQNIIPKNGEDAVYAKSRCITVFKKQDGKWKLHRWMPQPKMN